MRAHTKDRSTRWPEASVFFYAWTPIEDYVLEAFAGFVQTDPVGHLSLHFDGVQVDSARTAAPGFKDAAEEAGLSTACLRGCCMVSISDCYEVKRGG